MWFPISGAGIDDICMYVYIILYLLFVRKKIRIIRSENHWKHCFRNIKQSAERLSLLFEGDRVSALFRVSRSIRHSVFSFSLRAATPLGLAYWYTTLSESSLPVSFLIPDSPRFSTLWNLVATFSTLRDTLAVIYAPIAVLDTPLQQGSRFAVIMLKSVPLCMQGAKKWRGWQRAPVRPNH